MNKKQYLKELKKYLTCQQKQKNIIIHDVSSDIEISLEQGKKWEEIVLQMGSPKNLANEFNENLDCHKKQHKKIVYIIIVCVLMVLILIGIWLYRFMMPYSIPIAESKLFQANEIHLKSEQIAKLMGMKDYQAVIDLYADDQLKQALSADRLYKAAQQISTDWGQFERVTSDHSLEVTQKGTVFAFTEIVALYEHRSITFTLSFDKQMRLIGIYMK